MGSCCCKGQDDKPCVKFDVNLKNNKTKILCCCSGNTSNYDCDEKNNIDEYYKHNDTTKRETDKKT